MKMQFARKGLSVILALVMMLGLIPAVSIGVSAEDVSNTMPEANSAYNGFIMPTDGVVGLSVDLTPQYGSNGKFIAPIGTPAVGSIPISNKAGLEDIKNNLSGTYHLTADIDLSGEEWEPIGNNSVKFTGVFDGQGYIIKNMKITGEHRYAGLFGNTDNAVIKNVGMEDTCIDVFSSYAGGISGVNYNNSNISNCYNTGAVSSLSSTSAPYFSHTGGISGAGGDINNCYNTGDVFSSSSSSSSASYAGGISGSGSTYTGNISRCYNTGDVSSSSSSFFSYTGGISGFGGDTNNCYNTGAVSSSSDSTSYAGGICGSSYGDISNCYNTGAVSSSSDYSYAGGICGYNGSSINNCYWNEGNAQTGVGYGIDTTTCLTTEQMKQQISFVGFDFDAVWAIDPSINNGYPYLRSNQAEATEITITATAGTNGVVSGGGVFDIGDEVTLVATADSGYKFSGWFENNTRISGASATYSFLATADRTIEARFILESATNIIYGKLTEGDVVKDRKSTRLNSSH